MKAHFQDPNSSGHNLGMPPGSRPAPEPLATEAEVCEFLRIKARQLYAWRKEGLIPYIKIGHALRFRMSDIERALEDMTTGRL